MLAHAEKYSFAFKRNGGGNSLEMLEQGKIPEKEMWKYSSFWFKDFDGMALKTMIRQLISKWGIMSIELQTAIDKDMAVIHDDGTTDYIENEPEGGENIVEEQEFKEVKQPDQAAVQEEVEPTKVPKTETSDHGNIEDDFFNN